MQPHDQRKGAAAVEAALLLPLLLIVTLGVVDVGQFIVTKQNLCNASRIGARHAAKDGTSNISEVEEVISEYFNDAFPSLTDSEISDVFQLVIRDSNGTTIEGDGLSEFESGEILVVEVDLDFSMVQWLDKVNYWNLELEPITSTSRRE